MHLFAGGGGGILADLILGHNPICAVEWDAYCCQVLRERAAEGWFPNLHVWEGDVRLFDPSEYTGRVDCIHAGFPCQDISVAGHRAGVGKDTRSGLYREILRVADVVRPKFLFLENVSAILHNGFGTVLGDLAARGYDARWCCLRASDVGANHRRDRWWLLAHADSGGRSTKSWEQQEKRAKVFDPSSTRDVAHTMLSGWWWDEREGENAEHAVANAGRKHEPGDATGLETCQGFWPASNLHDQSSSAGQDVAEAPGQQREWGGGTRTGREGLADGSWRNASLPVGGVADELASDVVRCGWWEEEPNIGRVTKSEEHRVKKLKALGNGQVPSQCATAFKILMGGLENEKVKK